METSENPLYVRNAREAGLSDPSPSLLDPEVHLEPAADARPAPGFIGKLAFPLAYIAIAAMLAALFAGILKINNGTFLYTLDDPYIHLALSDQIRHGNYGLYPGTHAAPSSSILYPVLLAVASGTRIHPYFPLIVNICSLFFTVEIMRRLMRHLRLGTDSFATVAQALCLMLMALFFNLAGVVFTGLEHSLHIALVAATVYGLALFLDLGELPLWLPAVLVLVPLVRYEGLALSIGAILVLALRGRLRMALATVAVILVLVGGFSAFLIHLGLPALPSSILSKSPLVEGGITSARHHVLADMVQNVDVMLGHPIGLVLALAGIVAAALFLRDAGRFPKPWTNNGLMSLALLCLLGGQAVAGRWGWLERYEDYAVLGTALIFTYLFRSTIRRVLAGKDRLLLLGATAAGIVIFGARYLHVTAQVPLTSNNIYEQQFQMHRFVDGFYHGPVAINDLGLVSYRNPYPVLDLGGLGSEKARLLIARRASADTYRDFVAANNVHLVIVYDEWFEGRIPQSWRKVGTMSISRLHVSAAYDDVQFYATDPVTAARVSKELIAFRKVLPPRITLTLY